VRASLLPGGSAGAARVIATVTSPSGARFDLNGSLASLGGDQAYSRIELSYAGSAPSRPPAERLARLDRVMSLDDQQWRAVEAMLALTPRDWELFEAVVESERTALGEPGFRSGLPPPPPQVEGVADIVNTILSRVNTIRTNLDALAARTPDRADVRSLLSRIDLTQLRGMLDEVRDTVQGLLDVARELREGFETFDVAAFRLRIGAVLTDLESAATLYQRMQCLHDPDATIRHVSLTPLRRLTDRAPALVLYALSRILDTIDASWDQRIADVIDIVPAEASSLCNDGGTRAVARFDLTNVACTALRPKAVGAGLGTAKALVAGLLIRFRYVKNHTKEEITATGGATAVAGATAGTTVKNPAHEAAEKMVERLENIKDALGEAKDFRDDCLERDSDVEEDLNDCAKEGCACTVPLSVLLQGAVVPTYTYVADLVAVRIDQVESVGLVNVNQARLLHEDAIAPGNDETAAGYGMLCEAYELLQSRSRAPVVAPAPPKGSVPPARTVGPKKPRPDPESSRTPLR
jgi:hypothetical protein